MSAKSVITIPSEGGAGRPTAFPLKKGKKDASGVKPPTRGPTKEAGRCSTTGGSPGVVLSLCSEVSSPQLAFPARNLQSGKISCRPDGLTAPLLSASLALDRPFGGEGGGKSRDVLIRPHTLPGLPAYWGKFAFHARAGTCSRSVYKVSTGSHAQAVRLLRDHA